ncbi:Hsp70 family protein [Granulicoccus phenolivorans]|uniref:Hsp70 family protein n=1 Tax=Granulicoccus phenolivorans TaxID=266854 RepID=UPI0004294F63|nr:Hsp70 family protein [Granulicoccus phenolivorans]
MHLGIDFGTTRTIVAHADRGNYPVVSFVDQHGDSSEFFPSVAAVTESGWAYGFEALAAADAGAPLLRSFKRVLGRSDVTAATELELAGQAIALGDLLTGFLSALRRALFTTSNIAEALATEGVGRTVTAVPAHAHSAQRFLTLDAFRRAGFEVSAMINEPSAAGFEYTHRQSRTLNSRRTRIVVYDLGGGTFDASLVTADGLSHEVLGSIGVNRLGGDDFDEILAELAAEAAGIDLAGLGVRERDLLLEDCRTAKEQLLPQSKRMTIEVAGTPVIIPVGDFYHASAGLVDQTVKAMAPLVRGLEAPADSTEGLSADIAGIYLVGGASSLPLVPRVLRETFGRRVHRSPYPAASTAIGLAIAADPGAGYSLTDQLSRGFGVFREAGAGTKFEFDPLLASDDRISPTEEIHIRRSYRAAHNLGVFRFVEYTGLDASGTPSGDLVPFAEVFFPFTDALQHADPITLGATAVYRTDTEGPLVEEEYVVDEHGIIRVRITDLQTGYAQQTSLRAS